MRPIATPHARAHDTIRPFSSFDTAAPIFFYIVAGSEPLELLTMKGAAAAIATGSLEVTDSARDYP
jgi:hypothetical protein